MRILPVALIALFVQAVPMAPASAQSPGADAALNAQTRVITRTLKDQTREAAARDRHYVTARSANLRGEPSLQGPVVARLPSGTDLVVTGTAGDGDWYQVQAGNQSGFIRKDLLAPR